MCGGAAFNPPAQAPFSGALYTDTACTTKVQVSTATGPVPADLGLGCLYLGGGSNTRTAPNQNPDGPTNIFDVTGCSGTTVSFGAHPFAPDNNPATCTQGARATRHCAKSPTTPCTVNADCPGGVFCIADALCFFGPPLPVAALGNESCVVNAIAADPSGTIDQLTGATTMSLPLASRTYLTTNSTDPCPRCIGGVCNAGRRVGQTCTPVGSKLTTLDCPPDDNGFIGDLAIALNPLRTSPELRNTSSTGVFCPPLPQRQVHVGAFGRPTARCILEAGVDPGDLSTGATKRGSLATIFCIPASANPVVNGAVDIPGPGATSIYGDFTLR